MGRASRARRAGVAVTFCRVGRFDCHQGPYTPAAWEAARRLIVKGIRSVDPERYLALQYELAYTARDIGNNRLALEWYDKMLANAERLAAPSEHWRTFFGRVRKEARQLHFEQAYYSQAYYSHCWL